MVFAERCYASATYAIRRCLSVRLSVRLSHSWILSKRINIYSKFFHHFNFSVSNTMAIFRRDPPPNGGVECRWGIYAKTAKITNSWLSIDDLSANSHNNCDGGRCSLAHRAPRVSVCLSQSTLTITAKR